MSCIYIVGLGPGGTDQITVAAEKALHSGCPVYFRTSKHPLAEAVSEKSSYTRSFDYLYQQGSSFENVYKKILKILLQAAKKHGTICYAVPGHPSAGEMVVEKLKKICPRLKVRLRIIGGQSFLEPTLDCLNLDLLDGIAVCDALSLDRLKEPCREHFILAQVYSRQLASRVKLKLLELYAPDFPVTIVRAAGTPAQNRLRVSLKNLDHYRRFDHQTTLYLPPVSNYGLGDLLEIMSRLRCEDGCPWDNAQTNVSLRQYLVEEAYEVVAAIDQNDDQALEEELGDLLLQVVFHSQIAREEERFNIYGVINRITEKLIRRHPHVFGSEKAEDASEVKKLWEQIKSEERNSSKTGEKLRVDHALPGLLKAYKLQKRAAEMGFDWPSIDGALEKAREELGELEEAFRGKDRQAIEEELGDYLFTIVNVARFLSVNPELALGKTVNKFLRRFKYIEEKVKKAGRPITSFTLEELDQWWEEAKKMRKIEK